jgi:hypothetical protein
MPNIRMVTAGAVFLLVSSVAVSSAVAQTATTETPGKPIQLLRIVEQSSKAKPKAHAKISAFSPKAAARRSKTHSTVAERTQPPTSAQTAATPASAPLWSGTDPAAPMDTAASEPAPAPTPTSTEPALGQFVVGGQMVQVASKDDVNEIDRAANDAAPQVTSPAPSEAAANTTASSAPAASTPATSDLSDAALKSDSMKAAPGPASEVGSVAWIAQVLAALGGAVAAGSVAWFLIGSTPQRTYG